MDNLGVVKSCDLLKLLCQSALKTGGQVAVQGSVGRATGALGLTPRNNLAAASGSVSADDVEYVLRSGRS